MSLPTSLAPLAAFRQFIVVKFVPKADGKTDKLPVNPLTGAVDCSAHDPGIWRSCAEVYHVAQTWGAGYGVGFVLTADDPFWCLDIDNALTAQGTWSDIAQSLCARLPGTAIEVSQSGRGLHVWGMGSLKGEGRRKKNKEHALELYSELRFIALGHTATGAIAVPNPATDAALKQVVADYFPEVESAGVNVEDEGPCAEWNGPTDDADLLRRALASRSMKSVFGHGVSFADLWDANVDALAKAYPGNGSDKAYDASSADAALAQHLAFWTGRDVARIERLMRQSKLYREKWDSHGQYLVDLTIRGACARQVDVLQDKKPEPGPTQQRFDATPMQAIETPMQRGVEGSTFLSPTQQVELFKGCVYIVDQHKVLVPGGELLNEGRFRATYGGFTFAMDVANERTTRNAWEAFTESQALRCPRADSTCFKPQMPPAAILKVSGRTQANVWWPPEVRMVAGDATPFLQHLAKLLPNERDRTILLSYLCACVQYRGVKFQWAPLIQGVEGNGKTLLSTCCAEAVGRDYVHWPKARKIASQFNAWLFGNLLYCVEDIHTPEGADVIEELKPMITGGAGIEIEAKGVDQASREICGNFIFNSNHKNGLRKTRNDRRFAVFYCAQQSKGDLLRDGMDESYMKRIYDWLKHEDGYAIVSHFLSTWQIPDEFNPAGRCQRAPDTSSTAEALANGLGRIEQEVLEAIEQDTPGFMGGWVSSMALDRLLDRMGRAGAIPLMRRRDLLQSLGYDWHPALREGRVNNTLLPDGGKPKLFIKAGHPALSLTDPGAVAREYSIAQGVALK